ncbi:MAG: type II toxin-antitoxin system RelE/ParE family toxin [Bacteroidota bacterium]
MVEAYSITWSNKASFRLRDIYYWHIENYSKRRANKVKKSIIDMVESILENPYKHPICDKLEYENQFIRNALVYKTYWIVYEIKNRDIFILQIFHTAMDTQDFK